ncbi:activator of basal transcription 1 [Holotrichia oblita]|uniref:Activator of basal transcription 1 n=1 Tax=Holotrichia oblita TaxID=644536 RepID=A0ACB9TCD3_HOLOL|nr:activator of basal transcription 1 [Holotrichia oblita]
MVEVGNHSSENKQKKPPKRGIIYLSTIPPYMNVTKIKEVFSEFGVVDRVYLQLEDKDPTKKIKKKKIGKKFIEGWVEFEKKSVAKKVAEMLNNKQVSSRKKSKHYDCIWNIKYLSGFKWTHLHERLAYEKAARRQKLRAEIQLAKKKSSYFSVNLRKHQKNIQIDNNVTISQAKPDKSSITQESNENRDEFIKSLFN